VTGAVSWLGMAALLISATLMSLWLTGAVRTYALRRALLDIPNERSSHTMPTPRGGGLAIALTLAVGVAVLGLSGLLYKNVALALLGGGVLVAGIGWLDDHRHVAPQWRFLVHMIAAVWALHWLGDFSSLTVGTMTWQLGWFGDLIAVVAIVWLTNLYNFMDGIDGIAAVEAVTVGLGGAILLGWAGSPGLAMVAALLAASCAGFLRWNWSPAKIFMGDIGSGLLGYCFAIVALAAHNAEVLPATVWLLLLGVFVMDATFTLIRRVIRGERWYTAHRSHAYQRMVQLGYPHSRVSIGVAGLNLLLLLPAAILSAAQPKVMLWCLIATAVSGWMLWNSVQKRFRNASSEK
jgi:Fuc2NAc and GlcNAc transferase